MANDNVLKFEELLRNDETLQAKLQQFADAYEGDPANEQALFDATIGKAAAEAGLPFSLEEGKEAFFANRELDDNELGAVAGGGGWCYVVGGSNEAEAKCDYADFHACAYVGVGFADCG